MATAQRKIARSASVGFGLTLLFAFLANASLVSAQYPAQYPSTSQVSKDGTAVLLEDYANPPLSTPTHGGMSSDNIDYKLQLGRVSSLRSEPPNAPMAASRFFVVDETNAIYILDKATKKFTPYIKFADVFPRFVSDTGLASGVVAIAFDPAYAKNGKFYTVHVEKPDMPGSATPINTHMPSLNLDGYTTTPSVIPPAGLLTYESVLIEWTDTNIHNDTFEGTARELLRVAFERVHPMGDLVFNALVKPGNEDYGNLYIGMGDGAQGEKPGSGQYLPQGLNNLMGKILRITPDINLRPKDMLSANGRYRIPSSGSDRNPFLMVTNALPEIYAYGFRHPHRLTWDVPSKALLVNDIGLHYWEEVNIVAKGANYGYTEREGNEQLFVGSAGKTGSLMTPPVPFPENDVLHVDGLNEPIVPVYPAATYSHMDGDSIGSGFVYRGKLMPKLHGKYIFNDITTGRIFYADLAEMLASRGLRDHQAQVHEIQIMYKSPYDASIQTPVKRRMYDIVAETFAHKGGIPAENRVLPGGSLNTTGWKDAAKTQLKTDRDNVPYGGGRADVRLGMGGDGEIYVLSKSDGMIRKMTALVAPPSGASK